MTGKMLKESLKKSCGEPHKNPYTVYMKYEKNTKKNAGKNPGRNHWSNPERVSKRALEESRIESLEKSSKES